MAKPGGKGLVQWQPRTAPPELADGDPPLLFEKNTYEADKSLKKIFEVASQPLTSQKVHGKQVSASCLLGKDANYEGVTFTAKMQPKIEPGQSMDIFFRCSELVELWVVKQFGQPKTLTKPSAFVILKERQDDGKWTEIGQTESVPKSSDPAFSVSIKVKYRGPDVVQYMHVQVFSYAFKLPNGVPIGDCYFILDDLVHSRTARVMKLPITSPNHQRTNGTITITGTQRVEVEDGVWMQVHFTAERLFGSNRPRASKALPQTYFEIWRQKEDGIVQVYRSEIATSGGIQAEWWPLALCGKRVGDSAGSQLVVRVFEAAAEEEGAGELIGESRFSLGECATGKSFPVVPNWRSNAGGAESGATLVVRDCKWIKLRPGATLETQPAYQKDLAFLREVMESMELDAASKEAIGTCMLFVKNRAMFWSMNDIVSSSKRLPPSASPLSAPRSHPTSPLGTPLSPLSVGKPDAPREHPLPTGAELSFAGDVDAAVSRLAGHSPLSTKAQGQIWRQKRQELAARTASRAGKAEAGSSLDWINVERLGKRFSVDLDPAAVERISAHTLPHAPAPHDVARPPRPATAGRRLYAAKGLDLDLSRLGARGQAPAGPPIADAPAVRPHSARVAGREARAGSRRPETARARIDAPAPHSHRAPRLLSARSRASTARSRGSEVASEGVGAVGRTTELREALRPLLGGLMRHQSACQHPAAIAPVSVAKLTPAGKFRFTAGGLT